MGALTVTAQREEVVDFTLPYYDFAGIQILMKKPDTAVNLFYFADVFTSEAWLCLFGVIVLTSLLLFLFERFSPRGKGGGEDGEAGEEPKAFDLKESIWFVIGSVTLAGVFSPYGADTNKQANNGTKQTNKQIKKIISSLQYRLRSSFKSQIQIAFVIPFVRLFVCWLLNVPATG